MRAESSGFEYRQRINSDSVRFGHVEGNKLILKAQNLETDATLDDQQLMTPPKMFPDLKPDCNVDEYY